MSWPHSRLCPFYVYTSRSSTRFLYPVSSQLRLASRTFAGFAGRTHPPTELQLRGRGTLSTMSNDIASDAKKLIPAEPTNSQIIKQVIPGITTISAPFARFGVFKVGSRATIVKLSNASLAVFSPSALTPAARQAADDMGGNVQYLIAPDYEHHIFLTQWAKAYPTAKVIGVEGLSEKRASVPEHRDVAFGHVFKAKDREVHVDEVFNSEFDIEYVAAHGNKELVLNHKASGTLIQADLMFNLPAYEQYSQTAGGSASATHGVMTKMFNALLNTKPTNNLHRRFVWYAIAQDKKDFADSIRRIDSWSWDRMIPCHGDVIETGAKAVFESIMSWFLDKKNI